MIILFYGKDTYRIREKTKEMIEKYKEKNKNGFSFFQGKDIDELRQEILSVSMFDPKKLIIAYDLSINKDSLELFKGSPNILLLIKEDGKDKEIFDKAQEFKPLSTAKLKEWLKVKIEELGGEAEEDSINMLVDFIGNDLWRMENEIKKLINYSKKISTENILELVRDKEDTNIWETIDAIAKKDQKRAIHLIKNHLEKGDAPIYILAMIASQVRKMISAKDGTPANYFVSKLSENFTMEELKIMYNKIAELDFNIKVGLVSSNSALDILICGV